MLNASNKKMPHRHIFYFASADTVLSESGHDQYVSQFLPDRVHPCGPSYASPVELGTWSCSCTPGSWSSLRSSRADTWCAPLGSCNACSHVRSTGRWAAERRNQEFLDEEEGTRGKCCYDICWSEGGRRRGDYKHMVNREGSLMLHKAGHSHTPLLFQQSLRDPPPQVNSTQVIKWIKAD